MKAQHDATKKPLVEGASYGFSQVSNGVSYINQCVFLGTFTPSGLARVKVTKEDVYYSGELSRYPSSKNPDRTVQPFILFPLPQ